MTEHLETYINAQKTIANYIMGAGIVYIVLAIMLQFIESTTIFNGLKIGLLVVGLIALASGYGYLITEKKLLQKQTELIQQNPTQFLNKEKERMTKVIRNFPIYQLVFIVIIIISLLIIFFVKNGFLQGIMFSVILYLIGNLIIEQISKTSILTYYEKLINLN